MCTDITRHLGLFIARTNNPEKHIKSNNKSPNEKKL